MESGRLADLHVHTTASDGTLTPEQTVWETARIGLFAVGITDHDSIDGLDPALSAAEDAGIHVVPGVEINTDYEEDEIHILGYYINLDSSSLRAHMETLRTGRIQRGRRIVELLNSLGVRISFDRVNEIAGKGSVGRPHVAKAIVEGGYAKCINEAFGKYLVRGAPAFVERYKITPYEAVGIVVEAHGVAVLAHPGNSWLAERLLPALVDSGLRGIEAWHTDHSPGQTRRFIEAAKRHDLIATGGSDSHGPNMLKDVAIGHITVDAAVVEQLRATADEIKTAWLPK